MRETYIDPHRRSTHGRPGRGRRPRGPSLLRVLTGICAVLVVAVGVLAFAKYILPNGIPGVFPRNSPTPSASPSPSPSPTPPPWLNPILQPASVTTLQEAGTIDASAVPSIHALISDIFDISGRLDSYLRSYPISFGDPLDYAQVSGVLTFRGNNFRSSSAFGLVDLPEKNMVQVWERPVGSLHSSQWAFSWTGTGWTGEPIIVQWDWDVQQMMNLHADKKAKVGLKECISATMDGNIYFYDLDDGKDTRPPIHIGAPIKGSPSLDPRGYPVLYVGQGDFQPPGSATREIGFRAFDLITGKMLYFQNGTDSRSYRENWGACDSSPIIDGKTDTLVWCSENGMIYTFKLNTVFDREKKTVSIAPEPVVYRYKSDAVVLQGIESSPSFYGHYAYFSDNSGVLNCVDLQTMEPVWSRPLEDDSDVSPVLDSHNGAMALYTGTEVDWQQDIVGNYKGSAYVYRFDPLTGAVVWKSSYPCWTKNAVNVGDDINGGCLGTPIVGKKKMADLVVFSFSMTNGVNSGNTLVAFNKDTGAVVWTYKMNFYSWSSPVDVYDADGNPYIVMCDSIGQIHLVDGLTGSRLFYLQTLKNIGTENEQSAANIESTPAIFGNQLVVGTRGNVIIGVTLK
jgi:outer membrane protein assembly factor BamB